MFAYVVRDGVHLVNFAFGHFTMWRVLGWV